MKLTDIVRVQPQLSHASSTLAQCGAQSHLARSVDVAQCTMSISYTILTWYHIDNMDVT